MKECDSCFKRPGEIVLDQDKPVRFTYRLCRWCRGVWTKQGWHLKVIAAQKSEKEAGDDTKRL